MVTKKIINTVWTISLTGEEYEKVKKKYEDNMFRYNSLVDNYNNLVKDHDRTVNEYEALVSSYKSILIKMAKKGLVKIDSVGTKFTYEY